MRSNFAATQTLLAELPRAGARAHRGVRELAGRVRPAAGPRPWPPCATTHLPTPQGSYGIQKFIGEQLVADYSRKGFVARPQRAPDDGERAAGPAQRRRLRLLSAA
jgi:nucleoside-diphosphate-sugar epimerase